MNVIKRIFRFLMRPFFYWFYQLSKDKLNRSASGEKLKKGISAVIAMKDEEYTIEACIRSLQGFADQIICIDNGSNDKSVEIVKKLQKEFKNIEIIEMPGFLLGDCRNEGLKRTIYNWHLRWDADMIAHKEGNNSIIQLKRLILQSDRPRTIQLPRINLDGDFLHCAKGKTSDPGEPILMRFTKDICYKEYGKFDAIKVPHYFKQVKEKKNYYIHCQGLKADENLIHRFHYFTWRQYTNEFANFQLSKEVFIQKRNKYLFGTNDVKKVNFRYQRQCVFRLIRYNTSDYIDYPKDLKDLMIKNNRFEVLYKNNLPYVRIDKGNSKMQDFIPEDDDISWEINDFFRKLREETPENYLS